MLPVKYLLPIVATFSVCLLAIQYNFETISFISVWKRSNITYQPPISQVNFNNFYKNHRKQQSKISTSWEACRNRKNPENKAFGAQPDTYDQVLNSTRNEFDLALKERGSKPLVILFYNKGIDKFNPPKYPWKALGAQGRTDKARCSSNCLFTLDNRMISCADLVVVHHAWGKLVVRHLKWLRDQNKLVPWAWIEHESPANSRGQSRLKELFQLTASYSRSSDLWVPYGKVLRKEKPDTSGTGVDHAKAKSKKVIAFMSNCVGYRIKFIRQLKKHVEIDFFGSCNGNAFCPRNSNNCEDKQKQYKFFLALENSFCEDYHTEKLYWQGYTKELIPITFFDYDELKNKPFLVPAPKSFINIFDFPNMEALADHLNYLSNNDTAYNEYHAWRNDFTVRGMDRCSLCEEAHKIDVKEKRGLPTIKIEEVWNQTKCIGYNKELFQKYLK